MKKKSVKLISVAVALILIMTMFTVVNASAASSVKFGKAHYSVQIGDALQLDCSGNNLQWRSSDTSVVKVSNKGVITGVAMGKATVTASSGSASASCEITCGFYKGIDVSSWNADYTSGNYNTVDWKKVKADGVDFAIIRAGLGWEDYPNQMDHQLVNNVKGCVENNIPFGLYFYSYATNTSEAALEANYLLRIIRDYIPQYIGKMTLPIAYDLEEPFMYTMNSTEFTDIIITFSNIVKSAGYDAMVYGNSGTFYNMQINRLQANNITFWYAMWPNNPDFSEPETIGQTNIHPQIWQYSEKGTVAGAGGDNGVDVNVLYMMSAYNHDYKGTSTSGGVSSPGSGSAALSWKAVSGAHYNLYRCELDASGKINTGKKRWLYSGAKTAFTDSSMAYGKGYYYYTDAFYTGDFLYKDYQKVVSGEKNGVYVYNAIKGDIDLDQKITLKDALLAQKNALLLSSLAGVNLYVADYNGDNAIKLSDAIAVQKLALK